MINSAGDMLVDTLLAHDFGTAPQEASEFVTVPPASSVKWDFPGEPSKLQVIYPVELTQR